MKDIEGQVKFLRLNNGEDIIAYSYRVAKDDMEDAHYILMDPLKVIYMTTNKGMKPFMSISLMQWVFSRISDKQEFKINDKDVLFSTEPSPSLVDYYYETIEHFTESKEKQKKEVQFGDSDLEEGLGEEEMLDEAEGLQMLKDLLNQIKGIDKKKLH